MDEHPKLQIADTVDPRRNRNACERCRAHKLKCIRSSSTNGHHDQCDRCAKAGLICHTCPSLPPGRRRMDLQGQSPNPQATKRKAIDKSSLQPIRDFQPDGSSLSRSTSTGISGTHVTPELPPTTAESVMTQPMADALDGTWLSALWNHPIPPVTEQDLDTAPMAGEIVPGIGLMAMPGLDDRSNISHFAHLPFVPLVDKKALYLDKLANLNASLLRFTADVGDPSSSGTQPEREAASVRQILHFVEEFLGILKYHLLTTPIRTAPRLVLSPDNSDLDDSSEPEFVETATAHDQPLISLTAGLAGKESLDYPTVLALNTCYVSLIRLYRDWLQSMLAILQASTRRLQQYGSATQSPHLGEPGDDCPPSFSSCSHLLSDVPHVLPGIQLGGFQLDNYRSLQISVFMQVSMDLLWRIERAVAALAATDSFGSSTSSSNLALLKTMLQREVSTSNSTIPGQQCKPNEGNTIGLRSLKPLMRTIRKSVRWNICLQLDEGMPGLDDVLL